MLFEKRKTIVLGIFSGICLLVFLVSLMGSWDRGPDITSGDSTKSKDGSKSHFKIFEFYYLKEGVPQLFLAGREMEAYQSMEKVFVQEVNGRAYSESMDEILYSAQKGFWNSKEQKIHLDFDASLITDTSEVTADHIVYELLSGEAQFSENIKSQTRDQETGDTVFIDSHSAYAWLNQKKSRYSRQVKGMIKRKKVYEDDVHFEADTIDLDWVLHGAKLTGSVYLRKNNFKVTGNTGEIYLQNYNKKLKYFVLHDDVKVQERFMLGTKQVVRKAFAEHLEGYTAEDMLVLTGSPKVFQDGDMVKGNKIILRGKSELVEISDAISTMSITK